MHVEWWIPVFAAIGAGAIVPPAIRARSIAHDEAAGVQKLHVDPTSRLGGAAVFAACALAVVAAWLAGSAAMSEARPLVWTALPLVAVALAEDLTRKVRPRYRLLAAVVSAALASAFAGGIVPRLDLAFLDALIEYRWIALALTWFMVAGACNAMNLIDGTHGLAAGTAFILFGGIAVLAWGSDDPRTVAEALVMLGALAGFLAWNYPRGKIFLGDTGAYFAGFMYAELSMRLVARNDDLSAWCVIVLAGYPIVDTLFSMYRRAVVRRVPVMTPDALHLHSLVFRRVTIPLERRRSLGPRGERRLAERRTSAAASWNGPERRKGERRTRDRGLDAAGLQRANAGVAPRLWLHSALCFALAVAFRDNTAALLVSLAAYALFYLHRYRALVRFRRGRVW